MPKAAFCGLPHSESEVYYAKSCTIGGKPPVFRTIRRRGVILRCGWLVRLHTRQNIYRRLASNDTWFTLQCSRHTPCAVRQFARFKGYGTWKVPATFLNQVPLGERRAAHKILTPFFNLRRSVL